MLYFTNRLSKLNFNCTIGFLTTRSSKLDHIWLYLDDIFLKHFYLFRNIFYPGDIFILFWNILFGSRIICMSRIFLTLIDLCDGITIVACAMSRRPRRRPRQTSRLRASGPWRARHERMDYTIALASQSAWNRFSLVQTTDMVLNFHAHRLMGPELWLPHLQRWEKATNEAQGVVIYHFRRYFHLSLPRGHIKWAIIVQLWNCFHATMGRHQSNRIIVSTHTARW